MCRPGETARVCASVCVYKDDTRELTAYQNTQQCSSKASNYSNCGPPRRDPTKTLRSLPRELRHTQPPEKPQVQTDAARSRLLHKHNIRHLENKEKRRVSTCQASRRVKNTRRGGSARGLARSFPFLRSAWRTGDSGRESEL